MAFFRKNKEPVEFDISSIDSVVTSPSGKTSIVKTIPVTVIEAAQEENSEFSYKYSFINPFTNEQQEMYDDIAELISGEQIFDVGDEIHASVYSDEKGNITRISREFVFPEVLKKKQNIRNLVNYAYVLLFLAACGYCLISQLLKIM